MVTNRLFPKMLIFLPDKKYGHFIICSFWLLLDLLYYIRFMIIRPMPPKDSAVSYGKCCILKLCSISFLCKFLRNNTFMVFSVKVLKINNFNLYLKSFSHVLFCYYMFYSNKFASSILTKH